jgi:hypothetical protein
MAASYWVGDEIALQFTAKDADGADAQSATVDIYDETNTKVVDGASATIGSSNIEYNVAESITDTAGNYRAVFIVIFAGTLTRRHTISFLILDPAIRLDTYGSVEAVEGMIGDIVPSRTFTDTTVPTFDEVQQILDGVASELNVELEQQGYQVPVRATTDRVAYRYMVYVNNAGAAARALSSMPMEAYVGPDDTQSGGDRRTMYDRELWHALVRIRNQDFKATRTTNLLSRVYAGSREDRDTGETKNSLFTRKKFDYPGSRTLQQS